MFASFFETNYFALRRDATAFLLFLARWAGRRGRGAAGFLVPSMVSGAAPPVAAWRISVATFSTSVARGVLLERLGMALTLGQPPCPVNPDVAASSSDPTAE
jgi:hypothetical protein